MVPLLRSGSRVDGRGRTLVRDITSIRSYISRTGDALTFRLVAVPLRAAADIEANECCDIENRARRLRFDVWVPGYVLQDDAAGRGISGAAAAGTKRQ